MSTEITETRFGPATARLDRQALTFTMLREFDFSAFAT